VSEAAGKIFCLAGAASAEAANTVHREAQGWLPTTFSKYRKGCDPASRPAQAIIPDRCITRLASVYKIYGNMEWREAHRVVVRMYCQ
jgi:hypothetical protein